MLPGITWRGGPIDDVELLRELPPELATLLNELNGCILQEGALHIRGASRMPDWHSLREVWKGPNALHNFYDKLEPGDIPFAQDQLGDQFVLRDGNVFMLSAETGELEPFTEDLDEFLESVSDDIEEFLTVSLDHPLEPGELLMANPPFCFEESERGVDLKPRPAAQVIRLHADLAKKIKDAPEGGEIDFKVED